MSIELPPAQPNLEAVPHIERPPVTDDDRLAAARWLQSYLGNPDTMTLVRTRLQQQAARNMPGAPSIIVFGSHKRGGYGTTVCLTERGLEKVSTGPRGMYTTGPVEATHEPATAQKAVDYFETYGHRDPRDIESWLEWKLAYIEQASQGHPTAPK